MKKEINIKNISAFLMRSFKKMQANIGEIKLVEFKIGQAIKKLGLAITNSKENCVAIVNEARIRVSKSKFDGLFKINLNKFLDK